MNTVTMKIAGAAMERGKRRAKLQMPCPAVQPRTRPSADADEQADR
jgi:hypothetical protein